MRRVGDGAEVLRSLNRTTLGACRSLVPRRPGERYQKVLELLDPSIGRMRTVAINVERSDGTFGCAIGERGEGVAMIFVNQRRGTAAFWNGHRLLQRSIDNMQDSPVPLALVGGNRPVLIARTIRGARFIPVTGRVSSLTLRGGHVGFGEGGTIVTQTKIFALASPSDYSGLPDRILEMDAHARTGRRIALPALPPEGNRSIGWISPEIAGSPDGSYVLFRGGWADARGFTLGFRYYSRASSGGPWMSLTGANLREPVYRVTFSGDGRRVFIVAGRPARFYTGDSAGVGSQPVSVGG